MGCPGIYTLDCYCDNARGHVVGRPDKCGHVWNEFPHQYTAERGATCRAAARRDGWMLNYRRNRFLCPKCNTRRGRND